MDRLVGIGLLPHTMLVTVAAAPSTPLAQVSGPGPSQAPTRSPIQITRMPRGVGLRLRWSLQ